MRITKIIIMIVFCVCILDGCKGKPANLREQPESSKRKTGTVISNGTELTYFIEGEGYPCIVVSEGELISNAMSSEMKSQFKFIFLNARMNMADPGKIDVISFDLLTDDVDQVRKSLNFENVGVFGHSISGLIALEYARKYPQHCSFVIMNGTPPCYNEHFKNICDTFWIKNASVERKMALTENWKGISQDSLNKSGTSDAGKLRYILNGPKYWYDFKFNSSDLLKDVYWNISVWSHIFSELMTSYDLKQKITLNVPVFLALGKYDFSSPYKAWDDQKEKIPTLSVNLFENSGHYPFFEEEELFRKKVNSWIEELKQ